MKGFDLLLSLAWRNLWRNRRRTLVILFALVLGVWAMVVTAAFMRGINNQLFDDAIDNLTGHLQIHAKGYLDDPVIEHSLSLSENVRAALDDKEIAMIGSRIRVPAVIASERDSAGVVLVGISPEDEDGLSFISEAVSDGRYLKDANDQGILIGRKLAERLETKLGRRVVVMSQNRENDVADRGFRIAGVFDTSLEATETAFIFMGRDTAKELLDLGGEVSEVAVKLYDIKQVDAVVERLRKKLPHFDVQPWHVIEPLTKWIVDMYDASAVIWHVIVFLAMGFGIVNTLLMAVFERTREFGLYQALGLQPRFILAQVWMEAVLLLLLGLLIGNSISWLTVLSLGEGIDVSSFARGMEMARMHKIIPFVIEARDLFIANGVVVILGTLTGLYPAWRASRLVPADALTRI